MKRPGKLKIIPIVLTLAACAGTSKHDSGTPDALPQSGETGIPLQAPEPDSVKNLTYTVKPGDILSAIAKETTGNGDNWYKIAEHNGIENPGAINVGDQIEIPRDMLRAALRSQLDGDTPANEVLSVAPATQQALQHSDSPSTGSDSENTSIEDADSQSTIWVVVEGSYYPKAIYEQPGYIGNLQSRVSPGTTLEFLGEIDDWIEVKTDVGTGYIHQSDVRITSSLEPDDNAGNNI